MHREAAQLLVDSAVRQQRAEEGLAITERLGIARAKLLESFADDVDAFLLEVVDEPSEHAIELARRVLGHAAALIRTVAKSDRSDLEHYPKLFGENAIDGKYLELRARLVAELTGDPTPNTPTTPLGS